MAVPGRKTVQSMGRFATRVWVLGWLLFFPLVGSATGQLIDSLDVYPPRWSLGENDCDARITDQGHAADPSAEGGACETVTLLASHGTKAVLVYPIEPVRPINELTATASVKGVNPGLQIGFRVRFPYILDPKTKRPESVLIYGSSYQRAGEFQRLGVSDIIRDLKLKQVSLRNEYGSQADVASPYVDAVVLNAYCGPGNGSIRIDELKVDAMVPLVEEESALGRIAASRPIQSKRATQASDERDPIRSSPANRMPDLSASSWMTNPPFVLGKVTRILEHNDEPLNWVRSLGFDAVWLRSPPTPAILSEAIAARMQVYAPAPSSPDPKLAPLLEPVAAWIVASDQPMDSVNLESLRRDVERLRNLPARWQRRLVGSPVENYREYAAMLDGVILDAPPRVRNLSGVETKTLRLGEAIRAGGKPIAIGIASSPNPIAIDQTNAIAGRIGTPLCESFAWQGMWRQVAESIGDGPAAVLYRSPESLAQGTPLQQNRAMAMSYVNRWLAGIEPWIAGSTPDPIPMIISDAGSSQPIYIGHRFVRGPTTLIVMTSAMHRGSPTLAGDGKTLSFQLPPDDEGKMTWRLTHFNAERLTPQSNSSGTQIEIVSPDFVEVIAISSELAEAGKLAKSVGRYARQAALDRWQLAGDAIIRSQSVWNRAAAGRVIGRSMPVDLLSVAQSSLNSAEELVRGGQYDSSLRLSRRADGWIAKSDWMLHDALVEGVNPNDPIPAIRESEPSPFMPGRFISSPPLIAGNYETQVAWSPMLKTPINPSLNELPFSTNQLGSRSRWSVNRIAGGDFERGLSGSISGIEVLEREGWTLGKRHTKWASSEAALIRRGAFAGKGALRMRVTPNVESQLPGGYEGTFMMIRSPAVRLPPGSAVRIDAMVRTLGFTGPHQGLLVYDSVGTQDLGVLVGQRSEWTPVTLFRQTGDADEIRLMMEVIGGGEAIIDQIQVRVWETAANPIDAMRPIDTAFLNTDR